MVEKKSLSKNGMVCYAAIYRSKNTPEVASLSTIPSFLLCMYKINILVYRIHAVCMKTAFKYLLNRHDYEMYQGGLKFKRNLNVPNIVPNEYIFIIFG